MKNIPRVRVEQGRRDQYVRLTDATDIAGLLEAADAMLDPGGA